MSAHNLRAIFEKASFREKGLGNMLIKDLATYKTN